MKCTEGDIVLLVLKRKLGETILINGNIRITVCGFKGSRVLLGITAPSEIPIVREKPFVIPHMLCRSIYNKK